MKIFSLDPKSVLVIWSVFLGFVLNIFSILVFEKTDELHINVWKYGFPLQIDTINDYSNTGTIKGVIDLIFWIVISLIILSTVRHFRNKNKPIAVKLG